MKFQPGSFPVPHQHGAWAMFLVPALMAMTVGDRWLVSTSLLVLAFVFVFLSHRPATRALRRWKNRRTVCDSSWAWALFLGGAGVALAGTVLVLHDRWIALAFGLLVAITFLMHLRMTLNRVHMSIPGEMIGVLGLTSSAPTVYLFQHGSLDTRGWLLWIINFFYFAGSIFYVKLRVRIQPSQAPPGLGGKLRAGWKPLVYSLVLLIVVGVMVTVWEYSWFLFLAYVPFFLKVLVGIVKWQEKKTLKVHKFGVMELAHAVLFGVLAMVGFHFTGTFSNSTS
ncbi:MAG: YwiC-like family protein [Fidelibacterota bacterium]